MGPGGWWVGISLSWVWDPQGTAKDWKQAFIRRYENLHPGSKSRVLGCFRIQAEGGSRLFLAELGLETQSGFLVYWVLCRTRLLFFEKAFKCYFPNFILKPWGKSWRRQAMDVCRRMLGPLKHRVILSSCQKSLGDSAVNQPQMAAMLG